MLNTIKWKQPLPTSKYEGRDVSNPAVALRTIYEMDTREFDKQKCFAMMSEVLDSIYGMPEAVRECQALVTRMNSLEKP